MDLEAGAGRVAHPAHDALGALFFEAFDVALIYDYEMSSGVTTFSTSLTTK